MTVVFDLWTRSTPRARSRTAWSGTCATAPAPRGRGTGRRWRSRSSGSGSTGSSGELVPVAEEAGVRLAAHPDDPPVERLRGTARLVNTPRQVRPAARPRAEPGQRARVLHRLARGDGRGRHLRDHAALRRRGAIAYVHFRNVRGRVPRYVETFVDDGDVDMRRDRPHPPRRGLRRRARARPRAGARLPGTLARRPRLHGRLHEGAHRPPDARTIRRSRPRRDECVAQARP